MAMLEWMPIMYSITCYGLHDCTRQENINVEKKNSSAHSTNVEDWGINCSFIQKQHKSSNLSVLTKKKKHLWILKQKWSNSMNDAEMFLRQWGCVLILLNRSMGLSVFSACSLSCAVLPTWEQLHTQRAEVAWTGAKLGLFSKAQLSAW